MSQKNKASAIQRATGINRKRLWRWAQCGLLPSGQAKPGQGVPRELSEKQVGAIEVAQIHRYHGLSLDECKPPVHFMLAIPRFALDRMLVAGRKYLFVVGDKVLNPPGLLMTHSEIFANPSFDFASVFKLNRPVSVVDVADVMAHVIQGLESESAKPISIDPQGRLDKVALEESSSATQKPERVPA